MCGRGGRELVPEGMEPEEAEEEMSMKMMRKKMKINFIFICVFVLKQFLFCLFWFGLFLDK